MRVFLNRNSFIFIFLFFYSPLCAFCQISNKKSFDEVISKDSDLVSGFLKNGFRYYLRKTSDLDSIVSVRFIVKTGHDDESSDEKQFSHLLEHLAFRGTARFPNLKEYLDSAGILLGRDYNAATQSKKTLFSINLPAKDSCLLLNVIQVIRDWAFNDILLDAPSVDKEKRVVLQEIGMWDHKQDSIRALALANVLKRYNVKEGYRSIFSTDINGGYLRRLKSFYARRYVRDMEGIIIVGNIESSKIRNHLENVFNSDERKRKSHVNVEPLVDRLNGANNVLISPSALFDKFECKILFKSAYKPVLTYGDLRNGIMNQLFVSMIQKRLSKLAHGNIGYIKHSDVYRSSGNPFSAVSVDFISDFDSFEQAFVEIMSEFFCVKKSGFNQYEFGLSRGDYLEFLNRRAIGRNSYIDNYISNFENGDAMPDPHHEKDLINSMVNELTLEDINAYARDISIDSDRDILIFCPLLSGNSFDNHVLSRWIDNARSVKKDNGFCEGLKEESISEFEIDEIQSENGDTGIAEHDELIVSSLGVRRVILPNGIRVLVKGLGDSGGRTYIRAIKDGYRFLKNSNDTLLVASASEIISGSGIGRHSASELGKYISEKAISISSSSQSGSLFMTFSSEHASLKEMLQIVHLYFTKNRVDSNFFSRWKLDRESFRKGGGTPEATYRNRILKECISCGEEWSMEEIDHKTLDEFYRSILGNDGSLGFVICHNDNDVSSLELILKYLGSIPRIVESLVGNEELPCKNRSVGLSSTKGASSAVSKVDISFLGGGESAIGAAKVDLLTAELDRLVSSRLRSKEGISYFSKAYCTYKGNAYCEGRYVLGVTFDVESSRISDAITYVKEEVYRLADYKCQESILESAKKTVVSDFKNNQSDAQFWTDYLSSLIVQRITIEKMQDYPKDIACTTSTDLIRLIETFNLMKPLIFVFSNDQSE